MADIAEKHDTLYQQLIQAVQNSPGSTTSALRKALTDYEESADLAGDSVSAPESGLPTELQSYVTKMRRHAYKVTDEDIERLRHAGYDEEAIFEITISTAVGAGTRCLERAMAALKGGNDALTDH